MMDVAVCGTAIFVSVFLKYCLRLAEEVLRPSQQARLSRNAVNRVRACSLFSVSQIDRFFCNFDGFFHGTCVY